MHRLGIISAASMIPGIGKTRSVNHIHPDKNIQRRTAQTTPNIVLILCDQVRADVCKREGFALDTTPFLDSMAFSGMWFNKAYTSAPASVPARTSLLSGRFPSATRVRSNHNIQDAIYSEDLIDIVKSCGYKTALIGKNHSYLSAERFDYWKEYGHLGMPDPENSEEKAFNDYLKTTSFYADYKPAPFPAELQHPARIVRDAQDWISSVEDQGAPFFLFMSIPEPHSPYQVSEPYFSLFPPESLPPTLTKQEDRDKKGKKFMIQAELIKKVKPDFEKNIPRIRSNYFGMLRLIDDNLKKFVGYLDEKELRENTVIIFISDHGDFVGEYGLPLKGIGVPDCLTRIPMLWYGPGIQSLSQSHHNAHVSLIDVFPTICDMLGVELPDGVQGRSMWPLLSGADYPEEEFESVMVQQGFGGLDYTSIDQLDPYVEGCLKKGSAQFDELNSWTQSGILRMLRKGDYKLVYDMQGRGELYDLRDDPAEVNNLFEKRKYTKIKMELLQDLLAWELRSQDPLPLPRKRYIYRSDPRNYWSPYRLDM